MIEIQYQAFWTKKHRLYNSIIEPWCQGMESATNGKVKMTCYPLNGLVRTEKAASLIRCGSLDSAGIFLQNFEQLFPLSQMLALPFLVKNAEEAATLARAMLEEFPEIKEELGNSGKLLTFLGTDRFTFASTGDLIRKPDDLKGKRVLIWDTAHAEEIKAWEGIPIHTTISETLNSLKRGIGQVAYIPFPAAVSEGFQQVSNAISLIPSHALPLAMLVNHNTWKNLPRDAQAYLEDTTGSGMARRLSQSLVNLTHEHIEKMATAGTQVYELSSDELALFRHAAAPANHVYWKERMRRTGIETPEKYIGKVKELVHNLFSR